MGILIIGLLLVIKIQVNSKPVPHYTDQQLYQFVIDDGYKITTGTVVSKSNEPYAILGDRFFIKAKDNND